MTNIVIEVKDPYNLTTKRDNQEELAMGTFVDICIKGKKLNHVFIIPRTALRENNKVWIMDKDNLLRIRNIQIIRYERENVIVQDSLKNGERIILTTLSGVSDGIKLRVQREGSIQ